MNNFDITFSECNYRPLKAGFCATYEGNRVLGVGPILLQTSDLTSIEPYDSCIENCNSNKKQLPELEALGCHSFSICPKGLDGAEPNPSCHLKVKKFYEDQQLRWNLKVCPTKCVTIYSQCEPGAFSLFLFI